jgi:hypothetical protein
MIFPIITSIIAILVIIIVAAYFYNETKNMKRDTSAKFRELVEKINNANLYEYQFDKKQQETIKNLDNNIIVTYDLVRKLQTNVNYLDTTRSCVEDVCLTKNDILKLKALK